MMILYTAINIPYGALSGVMTDDPLDRTSLNSFRMTGAQIGSLTVNALTLPLIQAFGHGDKARGYQYTVMLFAAIATVCFLGTFFFTRERIQPPADQETNLLSDVKRLFVNVPWLIMCVAGGKHHFQHHPLRRHHLLLQVLPRHRAQQHGALRLHPDG